MKEIENGEDTKGVEEGTAASPEEIGGDANDDQNGAEEAHLDWTPQNKCVFCADGDDKLDSDHAVHHGELVSSFSIQ